MTNRYVPDGAPLSEYERELLVILMEECAEVMRAASKLMRFGKERRPDTNMPNTQVLGNEVGDLYQVLDMACDAGLFDLGDVMASRDRKRHRLAHFMQANKQ